MTIASPDLSQLRSTVDGAVVGPGEDGWDEARQAWNLTVDQQPTAVAFPESAADVALAVLTVHHWTSAADGLAELRRIARRQVVLTFDPAAVDAFWLVGEYVAGATIEGAPAAQPPSRSVAQSRGAKVIGKSRRDADPSSPVLLPSERGEGSRKPPLPSETGEGVGGEGVRPTLTTRSRARRGRPRTSSRATRPGSRRA